MKENMNWYQVIEDNGGGLHLFIIDGRTGNVIYGASGYEFSRGSLSNDIKEFMETGNVDGWEMQNDESGEPINPETLYASFYDEDLNLLMGYEVVAEGTYHTGVQSLLRDQMGAAATLEFTSI